MKQIAILLLIFIASALYAQDDMLELLRSDLKTQKVAIVTEAMELTQEESTVFWPIYKEYDYELTKLNDMRVVVIKDFADHYETMTDAKAEQLTKQSFDYMKKRIALREKYYKKFKKVMSPIRAAKFMQIENQLTNFIDAQISMEMPLIEKPE